MTKTLLLVTLLSVSLAGSASAQQMPIDVTGYTHDFEKIREGSKLTFDTKSQEEGSCRVRALRELDGVCRPLQRSSRCRDRLPYEIRLGSRLTCDILSASSEMAEGVPLKTVKWIGVPRTPSAALH